jgi:hypothetical protein
MSTHHPRPTNDRPSIFFPDPNLVKQSGKATDSNIQNRDKIIMSFQKNLLSKQNPTSTYDTSQSTAATQSSLLSVQNITSQKDLDENFMRLRQCMLNEKQDTKIEKEKLVSRVRDINKIGVGVSNIYQISSVSPGAVGSKDCKETKPTQPGKGTFNI